MDQDRLSDYFAFRTLISTSWIKTIYIIGAVLITLGSIGSMVGLASVDQAGLGLLSAIVYFVAFNVGWRMLCEFVILFFSTHEQLVKIAKASTMQSAGLTPDVSKFGPPPVGEPGAWTPETHAVGMIPETVSGDYDRWVAGEESAYDDFIRNLKASLDVLPERINATFLRNRFRAAAGHTEFETLAASRE